MRKQVKSSRRSATTERKWRAHMKRQAESGGTIAAYCREHGITEGGFHFWRKELDRRDGESAAPAFAEVTVPELWDMPESIEVIAPNGWRVVTSGRTMLDRLPRVLHLVGAMKC